MAVPYEPYGAFIYLTRWVRSADDWSKLYDLDDGLTLTLWAVEQIRAAADTMSEEDRIEVERHRRRSFGRTPFDEVSTGQAPELDRLLSIASRPD